jgi:hypothetical protein
LSKARAAHAIALCISLIASFSQFPRVGQPDNEEFFGDEKFFFNNWPVDQGVCARIHHESLFFVIAKDYESI